MSGANSEYRENHSKIVTKLDNLTLDFIVTEGEHRHV